MEVYMSKKSKVENSTSSAEIKRRYIRGRLEYWKSEESSFEWDDTFEKLMEYVDLRTKEAFFQKAMEVLKVKGREKILDFGASMCWASYTFSKMGCDVVALDFDTNETIGYSS